MHRQEAQLVFLKRTKAYIILLFTLISSAAWVPEADAKTPPPDVFIAGLFPMYRKKVDGTYRIFQSGLQRKATFLLAVEEINNSTSVLPNTTIKFGIGDSRGTASDSVEETARLLEETRQLTGGKMPVVLIGPANSGPTQLVQQLCNGYKLPEISYSATSTSFEDVNEYKYLVRLPPSDSFQFQVVLQVVKHLLGTDSFMTLAGAGLYAKSGVDALVQYANSTGLKHIKRFNLVATSEGLTDLQILIDSLMQIQARDCNVVVVFAQDPEFKILFEEAAKLGLNDVNWVTPETFLSYFTDNKDKMSPAVKKVLRGVYTTFMENGESLDSTVSSYSHLATLWSRQSATGTLDAEVKNDGSFCSSKNDDLGNYIWRLDHDKSSKSEARCTGFDYVKNPIGKFGNYAPFVYDATWSFAHALHNLLYKHQNFSGSGSDFPTPADRVAVYNEMLKLKFKGATGHVEFQSNGDRSAFDIPYNLMQVQSDADTSQDLKIVGQYLKGKVITNANFGADSSKTAVCRDGFKAQKIESTIQGEVPIVFVNLIVIIVFAFIVMLAVLGTKVLKQSKLLKQVAPVIKKSKSTSLQEIKQKKEIKMKNKLIRQLLLHFGFFAIEFFDLLTDWWSYLTENFDDDRIMHSFYLFFILIATACAAVAIYFRILQAKHVYTVYTEGVKDFQKSFENLGHRSLKEIENALDEIEDQTVLLETYVDKKNKALISLVVALLEDVPQYVFNWIKIRNYEISDITMLSLTSTAVSVGYKITMPYLWHEINGIVEKQKKQKEKIENVERAHNRNEKKLEQHRRESMISMRPTKSFTTKAFENIAIQKMKTQEELNHRKDAAKKRLEHRLQKIQTRGENEDFGTHIKINEEHHT